MHVNSGNQNEINGKKIKTVAKLSHKLIHSKIPQFITLGQNDTKKDEKWSDSPHKPRFLFTVFLNFAKST